MGLRLNDRDVAVAILKAVAESGYRSFAPSGYYDDDAELVSDIAKRLNAQTGITMNSFTRKLFRVCNRLVACGVFTGQMEGTQKYYYEEPAKQREFRWAHPAYSDRIFPRNGYTPMMDADGEINFLLRHF